MALVLDTKYDPIHDRVIFYVNRFLRIMPLYWFMLAMFFLLTLLKYFFYTGTSENAISIYLQHSSFESPWLFAVMLVNFILRNLTLIFTMDYIVPINAYAGYLFVQQAWTLQLELLFYLLVPFLMRFSKRAFIVFFIVFYLVTFRIFIPFHILSGTLTSLFISNFVYFLLGMMSYLFLYRFIQGKKVPFFIQKGLFVFLPVLLLGYNYLPISVYFYFGCVIIAIPFLFLYTRTNTLDRALGQLSYPIYIMHFLVIKFVENVHWFRSDSPFRVIVIIFITIFAAVLIMYFFENPLDDFRHKRAKKLFALSKS